MQHYTTDIVQPNAVQKFHFERFKELATQNRTWTVLTLSLTDTVGNAPKPVLNGGALLTESKN